MPPQRIGGGEAEPDHGGVELLVTETEESGVEIGKIRRLLLRCSVDGIGMCAGPGDEAGDAEEGQPNASAYRPV
ncbi:MAG TPA: hypothetical protein VHU89_00355 [Acidobacteriaceae bacterium]|jgi:hypothetical protein|nr:hypothetical protein [Acidobacteriaceae bacterium]